MATEAPAAPPPAAPAPIPASTMTAPAPPPKQGSARERLQQNVYKAAGVKPEPAPPAPPSPPPSTEDAPPPEVRQGETESQTDDSPPAPSAATPPGPTEVKDAKGKAPSVGHLLNEERKVTRQLQAEIAELRKNTPPAEEITKLRETSQKLEARNRELEQVIAFTDYTKSAEFAEKYQKPYEAAWDRAMKDLRELTIDDAQAGTTRPITPQDVLDLVNLPLPKARELAEQLYGSFADDVMAHRKEIKNLFDAQGEAIEKAKKDGVAHVEKQTKEQQEASATLAKSIASTWAAANVEAQSNKGVSPYIKESDTDQTWNQSLTKGTNIFDANFFKDPRDPNLTPEQREDIIHAHAAIRNRTRAYGPLKLENQRLRKELEEAKSKLGNYRAAEPGGGEARTSATAPGGKAMDRILAAAQKIAH